MPSPVGARIERACVVCGDTYAAAAWQIKQGVGLTCSKPCTVRLRARNNTRGSHRPCAACGTPVWLEPHKLARANPACSEACQRTIHSRVMRARTPKVPNRCEVCGAEYEARPCEVKRGRRTCSRECSYRLRALEAGPRRRGVRRTTEDHRKAKRLAKNAAYRERHREDWNRRQSEYIKAHPEIAYAAQERRRARKANAPVNDLTRAQWRAIKAAFGNRCAYCGLVFQRLTMDHVIPLSKGGSHTASNVVPACRSCNCRKGAKLIEPTLLAEALFDDAPR